MKKITLSLLLLLSGIAGYAQAIIIKLNLGDCPKCMSALSALSPLNTRIPGYIIFNENSIKDAADIEERYEFKKKGFSTLYANNIYNKFSTDIRNSVAYYDQDGNKIFEKSLLNVDKNTIDTLTEYYNKSIIYQLSYGEKVTIVSGKTYFFNYGIGKLTETTPTDTFVYKLKSENIEKFIFRANNNLSQYNDFIDQNPQFKPSIASYYYYSPTALYVCMSYYKLITNQSDTQIEKNHLIIKYTNRKIESIKPIVLKSADSGYIFNANNFVVKNDDLILFQYWPLNVGIGKKAYQIAKFHLKNNEYRSSGFIPIDIPEIYKTNTGPPHTGLPNWSHPFAMLSYGQDIYNLDDESTHPLPPPIPIDYKNYTFNDLVSGKKPSLKNWNLKYDSSNYILYRISKYASSLFIQAFDTKTWKQLFTTNLSNLIPDAGVFPYLYVYPERNLIYYANKSGEVHSLSLSIVAATSFN